MRKAVLLRVGIDSGCGGIQGPLFDDKSFEFVCIPDNIGVSRQTYGTILSKNGLSHSAYFSDRKRLQMESQAVHVDPEFKTFTYGDPTSPKRGLRNLEKGDYLIFYCGLQRWKGTVGWDKSHRPALYIVGYFKVAFALWAHERSLRNLKSEFGNNFHVRHTSVLTKERDRLLLIKGGPGSRLLQRAEKISSMGVDSAGRPLKVLAGAKRKHFGDLGGDNALQRSTPRWIPEKHVERAIEYVRGLP